MAYSVTSNRGITGFPSNYVSAWQNYAPQGPRVGGGKSPNQNAAENMAYAQGGGAGGVMGMLQQLMGGGQSSGGGQQVSRPYMRHNRFGAGAPGTRLNYPAQGGGQAGGGQTPAVNIPPATTNPQTPVAPIVNPLAGLAGQYPALTSGQLSNDAIAQAMAALSGGGTGGFSGGSFADLMGQNTNRLQGELSRAAAQQQADMQHAFEVARANQGIQKSQLASDVNRQGVMHQLNMRNDVLGMLSGLLGGLI